MGSFYTQVLVCGSTQKACAEEMKAAARESIITPACRGRVVVCDKEAESQDPRQLDHVAFTLSKRLQCPTLAWTNHDDDTLVARIFAPGGFQGQCHSNMLYGGAYSALRAACAAPCHISWLWLAFARPHTFEIDRHQHLVRLLELPSWSAGMGYSYLARGEYDCVFATGDLIRT